jgi:hypothetical protein
MKFWKRLRLIASSVFVGLLLLLYWANDAATGPTGGAPQAPRVTPVFVR